MQNRIQPNLIVFFNLFLNCNWEKSLIGADIVNNFVLNNISTKDLEIIINLELPLLKMKSDHEKIVFQKILYLVFINEAQKYIDTERNFFLEKLPMFMVGLEDNIKIHIDGEEKTKSIREIIEERLIPIISEFDNKDRIEAEKILNL